MTEQTAESRIKQSKDWRQRLDAILQEMKTQQAADARGEPSRHLALSVTCLEDSIMRQGMRLKAINEEQPGTCANPYPESYNPANAKVEPTADGLKL